MDIPQLKQSNDIYYLENIENIIKQLFVATPYKASIGNNGAGNLCTSGAAYGRMLFELDITVPEHVINKFQSWNIFSDVKLDGVVENQLEIQGNLLDTVLVGYYKDRKGCWMMKIVAQLPVVAVSFKKVKTADEFNATAKRSSGSSA